MSDTSQKSCFTNSIAGSTSMQMQGLLNEFKQLYQNRLKKLEQQEPHNEETIQIKIKTLESYVKDLLEQNDVLIQTIDELEKEANSRVSKLENKLIKTSNQLKVNNFCFCYFFDIKNINFYSLYYIKIIGNKFKKQRFRKRN